MGFIPGKAIATLIFWGRLLLFAARAVPKNAPSIARRSTAKLYVAGELDKLTQPLPEQEIRTKRGPGRVRKTAGRIANATLGLIFKRGRRTPVSSSTDINPFYNDPNVVDAEFVEK